MAASEALILVPLDGSELAEGALPYAAALAGAYAARLLLLGVVPREPAPGAFGLPPQEWRHVEAAERRQLRGYLQATAKRLGDALVAGVRTQIGDPAEQILRAARRRGVHTTVMATHGRGGVGRLILGSVADKVMRLTEGPLLLSSAPPGAGRRQAQLRALAVPLDGSARAELALAPAAELARATTATLVLLRAEPWRLAALTAGAAYVPNVDTFEDEVTAAAQAYLSAVRQRLPAGVASETAVLRGGAADAIAACVRQRKLDLVVMTTRGRGGLRRLALGSTADRLVRAGLPVLLLREGAP
ncbi:MAG TPA: universal stress protein [Dehalococcoidia bacterium]|nr:universal stress protein [Dehalococcoidia bacterium]